MSRSGRFNPEKPRLEFKSGAKIGYRNRKINEYIAWSVEVRGYLKWKDLVEIHDRFNVKVY